MKRFLALLLVLTPAAAHAQMNVSTPAPVPVQVVQPVTPAPAPVPVQVVQPTSPPPLTARQLINPLLFKAAMAAYCRVNLCAPTATPVNIGGGRQ
jgi:hypothetical protein